MTSDAELQRIVEQHVQRVLDEYDYHRLWLRERLGDVSSSRDPFLRSAEMIRAIRKFGVRLRNGIRRQISENTRALENLAVREIGGEFGTSRKVLKTAVSRRAGRLLIDATVARLVSAIVVDLQRRAVIAAHRTPNDVARLLAGRLGSRTAFFERQTALVARVESFRAYNESVVDTSVAVKRSGGPELVKRISEVIDARNHPFSRAANGAVVPVDQPFRILAADVAQAASAMRKSATGVFWPLNNGYYEGHTLPAHYNDRGRVLIETT